MTAATAGAAEVPPPVLQVPTWIRRRRLLPAIAITCSALAAATELVRVTVLGAHLGGYLAVVVAVFSGVMVRRAPVLALLSACAAPLLAAASGWDPMVTWTMAVFTVFRLTMAVARPVLFAVAVAGSTYLAMAVARHGVFATDAVIAAATSLTGAAMGSGALAHQRVWHQLDQRAELALASREAEANRRVTQERLRIARDLHDVMGHEVAVISMQLGVAEMALSTSDSPAAVRALDAARVGVQAVLQETQQILEVLRIGDEGVSTAPAPGIEGLPALVASFRTVGLHVDTQIETPGRAVSPGVDTAVYRIVQECLTNAHRHGTGAASVRLLGAGDQVRLTVTNPTGRRPPRPSPGSGFGLVGIGERANAAGGRLVVSEHDRRFCVEVFFPLVDGGDRSGVAR